MKKTIYCLVLILLTTSSYSQCWKTVSLGGNFSLAIKTDSTLWAWGYNSLGQLGNNDTIDKHIPTLIDSSRNWESIFAGAYSSFAIKTDGTLWGWGDNSSYQLGINDMDMYKIIPTQIGTANNWKSISAGDASTLGLKKDGTLWAWGDNNFGQLGNGTTNYSPTPIQIGTANDWKSISLGYYSASAIKTNGTLWTWGWNDIGQLGNGTLIDKHSPTQIGTGNDWKLVSSGSRYSLATKLSGTLWGWGDNSLGQLGNTAISTSKIPIQIGTDNNWNTIFTITQHSLALKTDSTLWSWGSNYSGQLGNGTNNLTTNTPTKVGNQNNWKFIVAGGSFSMAIKFDLSLKSWGDNEFGQLGLGDTLNRNIPTQVSCSNILPITLSSFKAKIEKNNAVLLWVTTSEINTSKIIIERSENSIQWEKIGNVNSVGNSNALTEYSFIDKDFIKTFFYRLKFIDKDGSIFYSQVNKLEYKPGFSFKFYPNPVNDIINFGNSQKIQKIIIANFIGQNVFESSIITNQINISNLKSGIYILRAFSQEKIYQVKFIKL